MDKQLSTVRPIHLSLRGYLSTRPNISGRPHSVIAETFLTYLNCPQLKALWALSSYPLDALNHGNPFLPYCLVFWGVRIQKELSNCVRMLALQLFKEYDGHILSEQLLKTMASYTSDSPTDSLWSEHTVHRLSDLSRLWLL